MKRKESSPLKEQNTPTVTMMQQELFCQGHWSIHYLAGLKMKLQKIQWPKQGHLIINGQNITHLDVSGAWLLNQLYQQLTQKELLVSLVQFSKKHHALLQWLSNQPLSVATVSKPPPTRLTLSDCFVEIGKKIIGRLLALQRYLIFIGQLSIEMTYIIQNRRHIRWGILANIIYTSGVNALIIIGLLSLMVGIVITYQMGLQLRHYGADLYIIDLLGLAMLREFAPFMTAIMVAGRTGSAYTAELGMMQMNQEIDALNTMGVIPAELLILPRIFGLCITVPLLTIWADLFGILGGLVVAKNTLHITLYEFFNRFQQVIPLKALIIGIGKAPIFALIIASVSCFQGMQVKDSADCLGQNTTRSVVLSIFFVVAADALFSLIFNQFAL